METVKKDESVVKEIPIDMILVDPTIQPRVEKSEETIFQYSLSLAKGDQFPPIDVFYDGKSHWIGDGGHRLEAHRLECRDTISARVFQGGRLEALIHASGSNVKHGLLRDNKAKHRVVENVLKDPELGLWSNNKIAEICAVSQPFVGKVRWQLTCNGFKFDSVRVSSNGRQIETVNIGQKRLSAESELAAEVPPLENQGVLSNQGSSTEITATVDDQKNSTSDKAISVQTAKAETASQTDKPAKEKKVSISQLEEKIREYKKLIILKDEEIDDLKAQNAYLAKKIEELMEKYSVTENSEIEEEETA